MKYLTFLLIAVLAWGCDKPSQTRITEDFNPDWKFSLTDTEGAERPGFDDSGWRSLDLPHDWSIEMDFDTVETGASTGFLPGGIGWYRKHFQPGTRDTGRIIWVEFDGIYRNSEVWINGNFLGKRPNGYSSFSYRLDPYLDYSGEDNILAVRVDHSTYLDSRWYTGSGIYRNVRLVKTSPVYVPQWGFRVSTPEVSENEATLLVSTKLKNHLGKPVEAELQLKILDAEGNTVYTRTDPMLIDKEKTFESSFPLPGPELWDTDHPYLYRAEVSILYKGKGMDKVTTQFGIREARFDADRGFFLNGRNVKLKGVNLHHEAGCAGAAVPRGIWKRRLEKLREMGCNAIRTAHNPHDPVFLDLCDELGLLVIGEAFDEWSNPKEKHRKFLSAGDAPANAVVSYNEDFDEWAERDLKDMISRDFNHPSIIMWSIGNEVEWTYPYYQQVSTYDIGNLDDQYYTYPPGYDPEKLMVRMRQVLGDREDELVATARKLIGWAREEDQTRGVTAGCVHPSVGFASGYCGALDVVGFNYRAAEYDAAHETYPDALIYGSENWVTWPEWQAVRDRDFVAGIFVWTGFAYLGEAGPWPRKGLNISLFDFAGNKTPRGHLFESFWKDDPKVFLGTYPLTASEFSYTEEKGWEFTAREYDPVEQTWLRRWEWYDINESWNYKQGEDILVQAYTNCEQAELLLNGKSLGSLDLSQFPDMILKWIVPFEPGILELKGYNGGIPVTDTHLQTTGRLAKIELETEKTRLQPDGYDVVHIVARLLDENGELIYDRDEMMQLEIEGDVEIFGIDNGSEYDVSKYRDSECMTYHGRLLVILKSGITAGKASIQASAAGISSAPLNFEIR